MTSVGHAFRGLPFRACFPVAQDRRDASSDVAACAPVAAFPFAGEFLFYVGPRMYHGTKFFNTKRSVTVEFHQIAAAKPFSKKTRCCVVLEDNGIFFAVVSSSGQRLGAAVRQRVGRQERAVCGRDVGAGRMARPAQSAGRRAQSGAKEEGADGRGGRGRRGASAPGRAGRVLRRGEAGRPAGPAPAPRADQPSQATASIQQCRMAAWAVSARP